MPGSAKLEFPGIHIIFEIFFVANSNLIVPTSPLIDQSLANRQVDKVVNKSFESIAIES